MPHPTGVGLLYPGHGAEDDFPAFESRHAGTVRLPLVHTSVGEDAHRVDALLDLGGSERLLAGTRTLLEANPDSVMWACTSGSFVFGWDGARRQVDEVAELAGLPASSTSLAFVHACQALDASTVAVAASYPDEVATHFRDFLGHGGISTVDASSHGIVTAAEVGRLTHDQVVALVSSVDVSQADALLIPDTAMHSLAWLDDLESAAGVPVLTANQVTIWEGMRIAGELPAWTDAGALFERTSR